MDLPGRGLLIVLSDLCRPHGPIINVHTFSHRLQVQNFSHHAVELAVTLQEAHGIVLSGDRTQVWLYVHCCRGKKHSIRKYCLQT